MPALEFTGQLFHPEMSGQFQPYCIFKNARNLRVSFERFSQFSRPELDSTYNLSIELLVISKKGSQDFAATA